MRLFQKRMLSKMFHYHSVLSHQMWQEELLSQSQQSHFLQGKDWLIAVCPPNNQEPQPELAKMKAFRIAGDCFIKLNVGTWHAGPYFEHEVVDFYNLELSDTNIVDHYTHSFLKQQNDLIEFMLSLDDPKVISQ